MQPHPYYLSVSSLFQYFYFDIFPILSPTKQDQENNIKIYFHNFFHFVAHQAKSDFYHSNKFVKWFPDDLQFTKIWYIYLIIETDFGITIIIRIEIVFELTIFMKSNESQWLSIQLNTKVPVI